MTNVVPAESVKPAQWLLQPGVAWWDLVRFGPPGFEVYLRIAFSEPNNGDDAVRAALALLASYTSTPDEGYAAVWEGWGGESNSLPAPRLKIPNREMFLFTAAVEVLRDVAALAWRERPENGVPPHLAWPADRAWCLACEVDEEVEFTVGCSVQVADVIVKMFPNRVRQVKYGAEAPLYQDELDTASQPEVARSTAAITYLPRGT